VPTQAPAWQVSGFVQALPSSQGVPSGLAGPSHTPAWQASLCEQAFPLSHAAPSALTGLEQPVAGSQTPASWHWSCAVHVTGTPPVHTELTHVSFWVQGFRSSHGVPGGLGLCLHSHLKVIPKPEQKTKAPRHWVGVQVIPTQIPEWQESPSVAPFPSLHVVQLYPLHGARLEDVRGSPQSAGHGG